MPANVTTDETSIPREDKPNPSQHNRRRPWQRPGLRILNVRDAETGVNSTTDANATFS